MLTINAAISSVVSKLRSFRNEDRGATAVEYGLMVALIAAVIAGVVLTLGNTLHDKFSNVSDCVASNGATHCAPTTGGTP
jgi:pilus assembly protein Flp/PilA